MMVKVRHPNLLLCVGAVLDHPSGSPCIITELMDTSVRKAYKDGILDYKMKLCIHCKNKRVKVARIRVSFVCPQK